MSLSCHCGAEETGRHSSECGYYTEPPPKPVTGDIDEVKWNYDAASTNKKKVYLHLKTDSGARLVIEVERSVGIDEWKVSVRRHFEARVKR